MYVCMYVCSISGELIISKYVTESITMIAERFGHEGLCTVLYAVDKGLRGQNVLQSLLLILLRICSRSVCPISYLFHSTREDSIVQLPTVLHCCTQQLQACIHILLALHIASLRLHVSCQSDILLYVILPTLPGPLPLLPCGTHIKVHPTGIAL